MKTPHYCEIKVHRWKLLPKVRIGFLFDMYAWFLMYDTDKIDLADTGKMKPGDLIAAMIYAGAVSWSKDLGRRQWFTRTDIDRFIENVSKREFETIQATFLNSFAEMSKKLPIQDEIEKKKKLGMTG